MQAIDQPFYVVLASRILIFALVASSLNLMRRLRRHGVLRSRRLLRCRRLRGRHPDAAWRVVGLGGLAGGRRWWPRCAALVIGAISLRTRGVYFIMITLAFAQMVYYIFVSLKVYGGDDGLPTGGTLAAWAWA